MCSKSEMYNIHLLLKYKDFQNAEYTSYADKCLKSQHSKSILLVLHMKKYTPRSTALYCNKPQKHTLKKGPVRRQGIFPVAFHCPDK